MTKFEEKLEKLPIKTIQHPVGDTKYYTAVHVKTLIAQADEEIVNLKSRLQQQSLPVVPECVAGAIESIPDHYSAFEAIDLIKSKVEVFTEENKDWLQVYNWLCEGIDNQDTFALAFITRKYTVEKPQLFYLKNKLTGAYLYYDEATKLYSDIVGNVEDFFGTKTKFTQQEIDSMKLGAMNRLRWRNEIRCKSI
ncbi:DUF1642 domain-containing protein [Lactococcus lactis]|uniref:DUF1642 domain-containing protein n=1 Tax=Lactococcus lactis TaxID=1358 RepID=UPI0021B11C7A|nr:DUF1642 domain-containing protein [Lactococcus lactis]